jgi:hypothetical protein
VKKLTRTAATALAVALVAAAAACQGTPMDEDGALLSLAHVDHAAHLAAAGARATQGPPANAPDLARIRAATARYQQFDRAVADGFIDPSGENECVAHPELGAMGIHYVNFARYGTPTVDPSNPEILLYEPRADGTMRLVGVEFAVNAEAWYAAGNTSPPSVGGVPYDPPNPAAGNPLVQSSYTLHVWTWLDNPSGMFFPFNPRVSCPAH